MVNDEVGHSFTPRKLDMVNYKSMNICARVDQIQDIDHPLRTIDENHVTELYESFVDPRIGYQETSGLMTSAVQPVDGNVGLRFKDMFVKRSTQPHPVLRDGSFITIVDGRHRRAAIERVSKSEEPDDKHNYSWSKLPLTLSLITRNDGKLLTPWEILMFSSSKNKNSSLVKKDTSLQS